MPEWVYFALAAQLVWGVCSVIDKVVISRSHIKSPFVFIVLNGAMNVLLVFMLPFFGISMLSLPNVAIALASGLLLSMGVMFYYKAVEYDEISKIVMLFQLSPIFILVMSYFFLGERLAGNDFAGFALLLGAGFLMSYKRENGSFRLSKAFWLMLASAFMSSIAWVMTKHVFSITSFWNAAIWLRIAVFSALLVLLSPKVRKESAATFTKMPSKFKKLLGFKMVVDFAAFMLAGYAVLKGPVSLVSAFSSSMRPLIVFLLALAISLYLPKIIKESLDMKSLLLKAAAVAMIAAGVFLVSL